MNTRIRNFQLHSNITQNVVRRQRRPNSAYMDLAAKRNLTPGSISHVFTIYLHIKINFLLKRSSIRHFYILYTLITILHSILS